MTETANKNPNQSSDRYENTIGNTTFTVISKYIGDKPYIDYIKSAIKRDVEIAIRESKEKKEEGAKNAENT